MVHSLQAGGMERVMTELANHFSAKSYIEVHLVLYGIKREVFYKVSDNIVIHRPYFQFNNKYRALSTLKTMYYLRKVIQRIDPVSILSFGEYWNNLVLLSLFGINYPVYISDRSQPDKNLGWLHNKLKKWLYPKAAGYIAQTNTAKVIAVNDRLNNNIKVIGNPVKPIRSDHSIIKEKIVLTVGRLISTKHLDELIRIFCEIQMPGWKLVIVGGNARNQNLLAKLQKLVEELKADDIVSLEGTQSDIDRYYNSSSIFAFTSSSEGFPNVIAEAQSAGLPVIAFDCTAGPSDMIIDNENGYLVRLFDYENFKEKLTLLMKDDDLRFRFGNNARQYIRLFNRDSICETYLDFLMDRKGSSG